MRPHSSILGRGFARYGIALVLSVHAAAATAETGHVTGFVFSRLTRNALPGAAVSISDSRESILADDAGRFALHDVRPGAIELVVDYVGFETARRRVFVAVGQSTDVEIALEPGDAVRLDEFTVQATREGQARAIVEQRNAANIKNVAALDEWGGLPTQNIGELILRLPGISFTTDEDSRVNSLSLGGQPVYYTRLNLDGLPITGAGGDGRSISLKMFPGSLYESIEVIAAQTPDQPVDGIGGQINITTRSPLATADRRRFDYRIGGSWLPPWSNRNHEVARHAFGDGAYLGYTGRLDLPDGRRLGVALAIAHQRATAPHDWSTLSYQLAAGALTYLRDYLRCSGSNDLITSGLSARVDYKSSSITNLSLRFLYLGAAEPRFRYTWVNPSVTAPAGVVARYSLQRTEVSESPGASLGLTMYNVATAMKSPTGTLALTHDFPRWKIEHAYRWSQTHFHLGTGRQQGGVLILRTRNPIGFVLDNSDLGGRVFTQTAGPSVYNAANYAADSLVKRDDQFDTNEVSAKWDATHPLGKLPGVVKAGLSTVNRRINFRKEHAQKWLPVSGAAPINAALMPLTEFERQHGGGRLPVFDPAAVNLSLNNPVLWREDLEERARAPYRARRIIEEGVDAAYAQAEARVGPLWVLTGARVEGVRTDLFTFFQARTTPAADEPDPVRRAALDYVPSERDGRYGMVLPSLHVTCAVTANLMARAGWSLSYGRPRIDELLPVIAGNEVTRTVNTGNPSLRPQQAQNFDLKLEHYHPAGVCSMRLYRKAVTDTLITRASGATVPAGADNGYGGLYAGYEIVQPANVGSVVNKGLEFDLRHRCTFLPGALSGLVVRGNCAFLDARGYIGGTNERTAAQIPGFVRRTANLGLQYVHRHVGASWDLNYTGRYSPAFGFSANTINYYRAPLTTMNAGATWRWRTEAALFVQVTNLAERGREFFTLDGSRPRQIFIAPRTVQFGVMGQY